MKQQFHDILKNVFQKYGNHINADLLTKYLEKDGILTNDEVDLVNNEITRTAKRSKLIELLGPKLDDTLTTLCSIFSILKWDTIQKDLSKQLQEVNSEQLIRTVFEGTTELDRISEETLLVNLLTFYEFDLENMDRLWVKFCIKKKFEMGVFYDNVKILDNIEISDEKDRLNVENISKYSDIFESAYKKILIKGDAGCGKSTLVHEIARQWKNNEPYLRSRFKFVLLFRLTELNKKKTLRDILAILFVKPEADRMELLLCNKDFQKQILFIFDGYDEFSGDCTIVQNMIDDLHFQGTVLFTSRNCATADIEEKLLHRLLRLTLNGFNENGIDTQMRHFGVQMGEMEKKRLHDVFKVPLFLTMYCILKINEVSKITIFEQNKELYDLLSQYLDFLKDRDLQAVNVKCKKERNYECIIMIVGKLVFQSQILKRRFRDETFCNLFEEILSLENEIILEKRSIENACFCATEIGFLSKNSVPRESENGTMSADLIFPHELFSDYFAAKYFCSKVFPKIPHNKERFRNNSWVQSYCSYFATGIDPNYKNFLWNTEILSSTKNNFLPFRQDFHESVKIIVPWVVHVENQAKLDIQLSEETSLFFLKSKSYKTAAAFNKLLLIRKNNDGHCNLRIVKGILDGSLVPFENVNKLSIEYCRLVPSFMETLLNSNIKNITFANNEGEENSSEMLSSNIQYTLNNSLESIQGHLLRPFFKPIMKMLPNSSILKSIDIELNEDDLIYHEMFQIINPKNYICQTLQSLTIRGCFFNQCDNANLIKILHYLQNLTELLFYQCNWSGDAIELLVQQFCDNKFLSLKSLCFNNNFSHARFFMIKFSDNVRCERRIDLLNVMTQIVFFLKNFNTLKLVNLCLLCPLAYSIEFHQFVNKNKPHFSLEYVDLSNSCLRHQCKFEKPLKYSTDVSESIFQDKIFCDCSQRLLFLAWFPKLKCLCLYNCDLNLCSGLALANIFQDRMIPQLETLDLSSNRKLGRCVKLFINLCFLSRLSHLNLHNCDLMLESCLHLSNVIMSHNLEHLAVLDLSWNETVGSCKRLLSSFTKLDSLSLLDLEECCVTEVAESNLKRCFPGKVKL